ncbi:MAG: hypothetical protein KF699_02095 [Phycisphaeraceae bacterium]|nr:hypothetical protein [Phycisphaeraceae bacterium]MBX3407502.1 hypothetical protein [Phycisphaeraceae bacterium]
MGWQDRRYNDRDDDAGFAGAMRRAMRRLFVDGDDFFSWSLPLMTVLGIRVRVHLFYVIYIAATLIWSLRQDSIGFVYAAMAMGTLFVLVLLHEFGHCLACRWVGGEADRILMWPLGGLASCRPPHRWSAALATTLAGPGVNLALVPVLGAAVFAVGGGWSEVIFNPFDPKKALVLSPFRGHVQVLVWWAYYTNLLLLLFNMLLPMFPMDAGRVVQELLWPRVGYRKSMLFATNLGLVLAVPVGLFGLMGGSSVLFAIALFAGIHCYQERMRIRMLDEDGPMPAYDYSRAVRADEDSQRRAYEKARKQQEREQKERAEVDRILSKIAQQGMGSLTRAERKALERETERKRQGV